MLKLERQTRWRRLLLGLALAALAGCAEDDVLDGTWRQPEDSGGSSEERFELVLGQYGSGVAGLVRQYRSWAQPRGGSYGTQLYCRGLEQGRYLGDRLSFQFADRSGRRWDFVLGYDGDVPRLEGMVEPLVDGSVAGEETTAGRALVFERVDEDVDKECDWLHGLHVPLIYVDEGDPRRDEPERKLRAALLYQGYDEDGAPCLLPGAESGLLAPAATTLSIDRRPEACYLLRQGELSLAFGVFALFEDLNENGYWDLDPLPGGTDEPVVGVSPGWGLLYLDGELTEQEIPAQSNHPLVGYGGQGLSLVRIVEAGADGTVQRLERLDAAALNSVVVELRWAGATRAPRLRLP